MKLKIMQIINVKMFQYMYYFNQIQMKSLRIINVYVCASDSFGVLQAMKLALSR